MRRAVLVQQLENLMKQLILALTLAVASLAGCSSVSLGDAPATMKDGMLVNAKGMTLYTFDRDVLGSGKSVCNGDCAVKWPPHLAQASDRATGDYTIVTRDDGRRQWAFKGKPLYTWPEDQDPGDKYGDNYNKVWHIIK
jgi:predicted lipoprotein with Yx(FWY)xxD motif